MITSVSPAEAADLVAAGALLLDVREDAEFRAGRSSDARHIPLAEVPDFVGDLPTDRCIVCVCRSGGRSGRAAAFLQEQGFDVRNLEGGMTAWHENGLPMVADEGEPVVA